MSAWHFARQQKTLAVEMPLPPVKITPPRACAASAPLRCGKSLQRRPSRPAQKTMGLPKGQKQLHPEPNRYAVAIRWKTRLVG